jgi:hypothetical protein
MEFLNGQVASKTIKILIAVAIAVVVGIKLFLDFSQLYMADSELLEKGSHTTGTVVKKSITPGDYDDTYNVGYTFSSPGGEQVRGGGTIDYQVWVQLDKGSPIEIVFDPIDPSRNLPLALDRAGEWIDYLAAIVFAFGAFLLVWFGLIPLIVRSAKKLILVFRT